jgi:hypothetical protein
LPVTEELDVPCYNRSSRNASHGSKNNPAETVRVKGIKRLNKIKQMAKRRLQEIEEQRHIILKQNRKITERKEKWRSIGKLD